MATEKPVSSWSVWASAWRPRPELATSSRRAWISIVRCRSARLRPRAPLIEASSAAVSRLRLTMPALVSATPVCWASTRRRICSSLALSVMSIDSARMLWRLAACSREMAPEFGSRLKTMSVHGRDGPPLRELVWVDVVRVLEQQPADEHPGVGPHGVDDHGAAHPVEVVHAEQHLLGDPGRVLVELRLVVEELAHAGERLQCPAHLAGRPDEGKGVGG